MSKHYPLASMIAFAGLLATPVLAQSTSTAPAHPAPTPRMSEPATPPGMTPMSPSAAMSDRAANPGTFVTSDQQIRMSKVVGSSVYNEQKEKIGSIDEVLVGPSHDVKTVVLSVGGFLGMGKKLVTVSYDKLSINKDSIVMAGATKEQLTNMPSYSYVGAS